jgi:histidinol-phosphate phosphatase family protein
MTSDILQQIKRNGKEWTLFLDRDGVINEERLGRYVLNWGEFRFLDRVQEALAIFSQIFHRIILVTNQRGVGKLLMTEQDLLHVHEQMQIEVSASGGRIDKIYYCTEVDDACYDRKPNPGMAHQAKKDYPEIDFGKSVMVGNKGSDMKFGRAVGMFTVFIATTNPEYPFPHPDVDVRFDSLYAFSQALILG